MRSRRRGARQRTGGEVTDPHRSVPIVDNPEPLPRSFDDGVVAITTLTQRDDDLVAWEGGPRRSSSTPLLPELLQPHTRLR